MSECAVGGLKIHVEVPLFLVFFAFMLSDSVNTNLIIYRTCYYTLGYNKSECALLGTTNTDNRTVHLETLVQPFAAVVNTVHTFMNSLFSSITCMFIGSWSDRFGRKPVLIVPIIGYVLNYLLIVIFAIFENISPWYYIGTSLPVFLTGGASSYQAVLLCYITDVTNEKNRGLRMGMYEAVICFGVFLGNISSSYVFAATDYPTVFAISGVCCLLNLVWTLFLIPESLTNRPKDGRFKGLFELTNFEEMIKTAIKKRPNHNRVIVFCCILMLTLVAILNNGDSEVLFLYLREKFQWSLNKYTLYIASYNIAWFLGTILIGVTVLHRLMKIPEITMVLFGFASLLLGTLFLGLAKKDWDIYSAGVCRALGGVLNPMMRSFISKMVPNEEVGKIFALIIASESLFGMTGSPIYTAIYNTTITRNSAIFNFVSAGVYIFEIILTIFVIFALRNTRTKDEIYDPVTTEHREKHC